jgi:fatty acid desaturase
MNRPKALVLDHFRSPKIAAPKALRHDARYVRLRRRLAEAGFFAPAPWAYAWRIALCLGGFAIAFALLCKAPGAMARIACFAAIGFVLVQGCFIAHEASHGSVSRRPWLAEAIGQLFDTLLVGFSYSYFRRGHELHHFHCNEERVDPDTQSTLFSVFESSARDKRGLGRWVTRYQYLLIPLLYPTWALAMKWDALTYVVRNRRQTRIDQLALMAHLALWFGVATWQLGFVSALANYLGWSACAGIYLGLVIPPNHVGLPPLADDAMPYLEQQLATTRNLPSSALRDFLFMAVNNHVEHHLFPWVPGCRLRRGREALRAFCKEEGLPYCEEDYLAATAGVFRHFRKMATLAGAQPAPSAASDCEARLAS